MVTRYLLFAGNPSDKSWYGFDYCKGRFNSINEVYGFIYLDLTSSESILKNLVDYQIIDLYDLNTPIIIQGKIDEFFNDIPKIKNSIDFISNYGVIKNAIITIKGTIEDLENQKITINEVNWDSLNKAIKTIEQSVYE